MNFPACFKLTEIKTNSQCLHFIRGTKIGRAVNSSGQLADCKNQNLKVPQFTWKLCKRRRMAAKLCQIDVKEWRSIADENWLKMPKTWISLQKITWKRFRWLRRMAPAAKFCQCGNSGNLLSWYFGKNFVKAPFLLKKLLNSWFDLIFLRWDYVFHFTTLWMLRYCWNAEI